MKTVLVFGATGTTGQQIVRECLQAGYSVTAVSRRAAYPVEHPHLKVHVAQNLDAASVQAALPGHEVVVSAVGNRDYSDPMMVVFPLAQHIFTGLGADNPVRVLIIAGMGLLQYDATRMYKDLSSGSGGVAYPRADHFAAYQFVREQPNDWTIVCPPEIVPQDADGNYAVTADYFPVGMRAVISAGNIGHFVAHEVERAEFIRKRVGIGSRA